MAKATICDRCGILIKNNEFYSLTEEDQSWRYSVVKCCHPYPEDTTLDLCRDCQRSLLNWLEEMYHYDKQ